MVKENSSIRMIVTLVVIACVIAFAMSYVNGLTAPVIEKNAEIALNKSLAEVLPAESYDILAEDETATVYEAKNSGERIGVCVVNSVKGYGGDIKVMSGILNDGTVNKIDILEMSETAGLGAKSDSDEYKAQYEGRSGVIGVSKISKSEKEVLAISGATITSKAVTDAVNSALEIAKQWGDK